MDEHKIDEALEFLWLLEESTPEENYFSTSSCVQETSLLKEMVKQGLIVRQRKKVSLTPEGRETAKNIVRRHRLAERLFADVLDLEQAQIEGQACHFEHLLSEESADSICILLGHPRTCPHGKPIPPGECCTEKVKEVRPLVIPLTILKPGEKASVAYIGTKDEARLTKLISLGIVPGNKITLLYDKPSFIAKIDETKLALDEKIAAEIFVRREIKK